MNVLAFDACFGAVSVAVRCTRAGREQLAYRDDAGGQGGPAEHLMPMIAEVMAEAGLGFDALDRIAVTLGPGGFTGVRAGIAAARALVLAAAKPVVGTTSLAVMAAAAAELLPDDLRQGRPMTVAVDARRGMVYVQQFEGPGNASAPMLLSPAEAAGLLGKRPAVVVGSGAAAVVEATTAAGGPAQGCLPDLEPHARTLVLLAPGLAPISPVRPIYLRPLDAKPQLGHALARAQP